MYEVIKRNLGYKLVSLALAILFWLWVSHQGSGQGLTGDQTFTIPLVTKNTPANTVVMTRLPAVRVRLQGNNPSFNIKDLYAYVDLSTAATGEQPYNIQIDSVPGIRILETVPDKITLKIDAVQEKSFPVELKLTGTLAEGHVTETPIIRPSVVSVRGPGTLLSLLDKVIVEVSVSEATSTLQVSRPIMLRDKAGKPIFGPDPTVEALTTFPTSVDVIVPILEKEMSSKMIPLRISSRGNPAKGLIVRSLSVVPDNVLVFGTSESLKGLEYLNLGPVDVTGIAEDKTYQITPDRISLPPGITFTPGINFTVIAKVGLGVQEKILNGLPVQVKNLGQNLEVSQGPLSVNITVKGTPEDLNKLTNDNLTLWVDATGVEAGKTAELKVFWQAPPGIEIVAVPNVTVTLKETTKTQ